MSAVVEGLQFLVGTYPGIEYYILAGTTTLMCVGTLVAGKIIDRQR